MTLFPSIKTILKNLFIFGELEITRNTWDYMELILHVWKPISTPGTGALEQAIRGQQDPPQNGDAPVQG